MPERIIDTPVNAELEKSFLEYAMSVIVSRALPDVRDGLKPVHRRIIYAMYDAGLRSDRPYRKSVAAVSDTMKRFHPHGDSAIYDALIRLAQPWAMRLRLVDGHGNLGSLDDAPAAMRYTEARLGPAAEALVAEVDEDTVEFHPNFDGSDREPEVLPAAFPNLLVNGAAGIAVGMATNMAPHNLVEVVAGLKALLAEPDLGLDGLMAHIPGPDLPGGGLIIGRDGIREAYATGRGSFRMRATATIEDVSARRKGIVVTELPYLVGPERVIARIKELVAARKLAGVANVGDYSDRKSGLRLVIECKTGFNPAAVLEELYRLTPLEESFGVNNVALVDGQPRTLGLVELCRLYLDHRVEVVRRRTRYRLAKAEARAHIVEGLLVALAAIDEVVATIRKSRTAESARTNLTRQFRLSEVQAAHILEMPLRRLTSLEVAKLRDELKALQHTIRGLRRILESDTVLRGVVADELDAAAARFGTPRRSRILDEAPAVGGAAAGLEIPDEPCVVTLTTTGLIGRAAAGQAGRPKPGRHDVLAAWTPSTNRGTIGAVTSAGRVVRVAVVELPEVTGKDRGGRVSEFVALGGGETVVALVPWDAPGPDATIVLATAGGTVKRVAYTALATKQDVVGIVALGPGDRVVGAFVSDGTEDLVLVTSDAQLLRTPAGKIRAQGRSAAGVAGIRLGADATVIAVGAVAAGADGVVVATASDAGSVKLSAAGDYPAKGRATGGVRCHTFRKGERRLAAAWVGAGTPAALGAGGEIVDVPAGLSRRDASGSAAAKPVCAFGTPRSRAVTA